MSLYNEKFFNLHQTFNNFVYIKLAGILYPDKNYRIVRKNINKHIIGYVLNGNLHIETNNKQYVLSEGDTFILTKGSNYKMFSDRSDPHSMLWMHVQGNITDSLIENYFANRKFIHSHINISNKISKILKMADKSGEDNGKISLMLHSILLDIKSSLFNIDEQMTSFKLDKEFELYIQNNIQQKFNLTKMANYFELSTSYINNIFKKIYKKTPYQYYQKLRLDYCVDLLKNTNMSIEDLSQKMNFNDRNHFTNFFIKNKGVSPVKFRKKYKNM